MRGWRERWRRMLPHGSRRRGGRGAARARGARAGAAATPAMLRLIALLALAGTASASTIRHLDPATLEAEAERIVEGTIVAKATSWNAARTGFETRVTIAVERT